VLLEFIAWCEQRQVEHVSTELAIEWATSPPRGGNDGVYHSRRLMVVRIFARHLKTRVPTTEIPPPDVLPYHYRRVTPHVFTPAQIDALLAATNELGPRLRAVGWRMLIGLLAVTGLRISEACNLDRDDVERDTGVVRILDTKFNKHRIVVLGPSSLQALTDYEQQRDALRSTTASPALLLSAYETRLDAGNAHRTFAELVAAAGIRTRPGQRRPRLADLRHSFAVWTLLDWYRDGADVQARLPALSTWLGHIDPKSTYWYLQAVPELLALAADRLEDRDRQVRP
jgi:site-specific recombinase XerD